MFFFIQVIPGYIQKNPELLTTGIPTLDQIVYVVLSTAMFIAGLMSAILDNTIPGKASFVSAR